MIRRFYLSMLLSLLITSGLNAQIATPYFDPSIGVVSPAAVGWRSISSINWQFGSAKGDVDTAFDDDEVETTGVVKSGAAGKGNDDMDKGFGVPAPSVTYITEDFGFEISYNIGNGLLTDIDDESAIINTDLDMAKKTDRIDFAMPFENFSIGLGYHQILYKQRTYMTLPDTGSVYKHRDIEQTKKILSLAASLKVADIVFLTGGAEYVEATGYEEDQLDTTAPSEYMPNSWINLVLGLGLKIGQPGETQFRCEISQVSSSESVIDADTGKRPGEHRKATDTYVNMEVLIGDFLIALRRQELFQDKIDGHLLDYAGRNESTIKTYLGFGWVPEDGVSATVYYIDHDQKRRDEDTVFGVLKTDIHPKGYIVSLSYRF